MSQAFDRYAAGQGPLRDSVPDFGTSSARRGEAYIYEALRSPLGRGKPDGQLAGIRPDDLLGDVLAGLVRKAGVDPAAVEDVIAGCVTQVKEQGVNVARNAALAAGFPVSVCGTSVNRLCGSSQQAAHFAAAVVGSGQAELLIAAGVESMSRVPMGSDFAPFSERLQDRFELYNQGIAAELMCERWKLSRKALDAYSVDSHLKAIAAIDAGRFEAEILPITLPDGKLIKTDQGPRRDTSPEALAKLKPSFKEGGCITAGNSSQLTDGAAALLIGSEQAGKRHGLRPIARFVAATVVGTDPTIMLAGPMPATEKVLKRAGLKLADIDLFELNEAFATVPLAWLFETHADPKRLNVNGGAIALGHPLGCTGARLLTSITHELHRRKGRYGLVTMCIGLGQATATIIERM